jgi:hypothetical protein
MGNILASKSARGARAVPRRRFISSRAITFAAALVLSCAGCGRMKPVDTSPLDNSGMSYDAVQQLHTLNISAAEVNEMATARQSGFSDDDCVALLKIYRSQNRPFDAGAAVAGLTQVGMADANILELARLNQLGLGWGELQAMKLAGMSDAIVVEVARQRAGGRHVLSGATLARLKNSGVRESTLLKLVQRAVPESEGRAILAYRRRGASEAEILRRFAGY